MKQSIYISDQGELLLIDAPEKPQRCKTKCHDACQCDVEASAYSGILASAIAKGVKFKDIFETWKVMDKAGCFSEGLTMVECKGQTFPLPTGYKVSFEDDCTLNECNCPNPAKEGHVKLAILSKLEEEKKEEPPFNPHLVCGPKPKQFSNSQKLRLAEKLQEKKGKITDAQRIDMDYVMTGKPVVAPSEEVKQTGMDVLKIYRFQAKQIEDTFRILNNILEFDKKNTSADRDAMQSWQMIKNVLSGNIDTHVKRF